MHTAPKYEGLLEPRIIPLINKIKNPVEYARRRLGESTQHSFSFPTGTQRIGVCVKWFMRAFRAYHLSEDLLHRADYVASEMITNAIRYGRAKTMIHACLDVCGEAPDRLFTISALNESPPDFIVSPVEVDAAPHVDQTHGRGLGLIAHLSDFAQVQFYPGVEWFATATLFEQDL